MLVVPVYREIKRGDKKKHLVATKWIGRSMWMVST
jgi:hypothetical protein